MRAKITFLSLIFSFFVGTAFAVTPDDPSQNPAINDQQQAAPVQPAPLQAAPQQDAQQQQAMPQQPAPQQAMPQQDMQQQNAGQQQNALQQNPQQQSAQANKDGEIIAFLVVLNKNEIDASKEALKKNLRPSVRRYAVMLNHDHNRNLRKTLIVSRKTGIEPQNTDATEALKEKGKELLTNLKSMNNQQFTVAFITAMVKGHEEALNKLDESINNASNPILKRHLERTRDRINQHLQKAKMIQDRIQSA